MAFGAIAPFPFAHAAHTISQAALALRGEDGALLLLYALSGPPPLSSDLA